MYCKGKKKLGDPHCPRTLVHRAVEGGRGGETRHTAGTNVSMPAPGQPRNHLWPDEVRETPEQSVTATTQPINPLSVATKVI